LSAAAGAAPVSLGAGVAIVGAGTFAFADCAAVGTGMAFCRVARKPPPAAAEMQATASTANASRFDMKLSLTSTG
jgi:hypothetical protein